MRIFFLLILVFELFVLKANDSSSKAKPLKFSIEFGSNTSYLLSNKVNNNFRNYYLSWYGITSVSLAYQINLKNKSIFSYSCFGNSYNNKAIIGEITSLDFQHLSLAW